MKVVFKVLLECFVFVTLISAVSCTSFYRKYYTDPDVCYASAKCHEPFDVIIVPGFPHDSGKWDPLVKCRVYWAVFLYQKGLTKNIIFSGSAVYTPYVESKAMAMYAEKLGVPAEHIFTETEAEHSTENLYYSNKLALSKGFKSIALATDPSQSSFLKSMQRKFNIDIVYLPIVSDSLETMYMIDPVIDDYKAYVENFKSLPEREGLWKRLRGTRGHKVKQLMREELRKLKEESKKSS